MAMAEIFDIDSIMCESDDGMFDSDSDSDFELFQLFTYFDSRKATRRRCRTNHFETCSDEEFSMYFRVSKPTVLKLFDQIEDKFDTPEGSYNSVPPMIQLLLTLRFYAMGTTPEAAAEFMGVRRSAACAVVGRVSRAIAGLRAAHIRLPQTSQEIRETQLKFYQRARFPKVVGCLNCTHIQLLSPGGNTIEYRNRKGFYSLNVQTVCDSNLRLLDVVAQWPGSVPNRRILNASVVKDHVGTGRFGFLLGDLSYGPRSYLMTPIQQVQGPDEELYNESQARTRSSVAELYGTWKNRFPILLLGMRVGPDRAADIVVACAVLHNLARDADEAEPLWDSQVVHPDLTRDQMPQCTLPDQHASPHARTSLIEGYFRTLLEQYEQREP